MGQNDKRVAEIVLGNCVQLTFIFGLMYVLGFSFFLDPLLRMFGASENSLPYARIPSLGTPGHGSDEPYILVQ